MRLSAPKYQLKRRAKTLARDKKIALHEALDRIAREGGFAGWSLLSSRFAMNSPSKAVLSRLADGDLLLLGARPGQGKTLLGLQLLLDAACEGRRAVFFTLEYTERETLERVRSLDDSNQGLSEKLDIVASDDISADFIVRHLSGSPRGTGCRHRLSANTRSAEKQASAFGPDVRPSGVCPQERCHSGVHLADQSLV